VSILTHKFGDWHRASLLINHQFGSSFIPRMKPRAAKLPSFKKEGLNSDEAIE